MGFELEEGHHDGAQCALQLCLALARTDNQEPNASDANGSCRGARGARGEEDTPPGWTQRAVGQRREHARGPSGRHRAGSAKQVRVGVGKRDGGEGHVWRQGGMHECVRRRRRCIHSCCDHVGGVRVVHEDEDEEGQGEGRNAAQAKEAAERRPVDPKLQCTPSSRHGPTVFTSLDFSMSELHESR